MTQLLGQALQRLPGSLGRPRSMHRATLTHGPNCSRASGLQSALNQVTRLPTAHRPALAIDGKQDQITNACLQSSFWVCSHQFELSHTGLCPWRAKDVILLCHTYTQLIHNPDYSRFWFPDAALSFQIPPTCLTNTSTVLSVDFFTWFPLLCLIE